MPGRHNQLNAAAAVLATVRLGGEAEAAARGLAGFAGVERRLELIAEWPGLRVFDDYAHHPTEVAASLSALRAAHPGARLAVVFQPHLYSRTRDFAGDFAEALGAADEARVLPVYPAREARLPGVGRDLIIGAPGSAARPIERGEAVRLAEPGRLGRDAVLAYMGAGDVTGVAREAIGRRHAVEA